MFPHGFVGFFALALCICTVNGQYTLTGPSTAIEGSTVNFTCIISPVPLAIIWREMRGSSTYDHTSFYSSSQGRCLGSSIGTIPAGYIFDCDSTSGVFTLSFPVDYSRHSGSVWRCLNAGGGTGRSNSITLSVPEFGAPAVSELNGAATLSWLIPAGGMGTGSSLIAISPAGIAAFILTSGEQFIPTINYSGRIDFTGNYSTRNITFTLRNISTADAGIYRCGNGAVNDVISDCGQMLVVLGKPTKPPRPSSSTTPVYMKRVTLTCTSTSTSLPAGNGLTLTYIWERGGSVVTPNPWTPFTFTVTSRDPHNYRCRAVEIRGLESDWSDVYRMEPEYGPYQETLTPPGSSYTVVENQDIISPISCSANCKPACSYRWEKNGTSFTNSTVLNMGQPSRSQTGSYRCQASNKHGSVYTSAVSVDVQYLDRPNFTMYQTEVREDESVRMECSTLSHPTARLMVRNIDNDTVITGQTTEDLLYTIPRAQCLHNGSFVCSGEIKESGVLYSREIQLNVLCAPRLDWRKPLKGNVSSGLDEIASLLLNVISNPAPTFHWYLSDNEQLVPIPNVTKHEVISTARYSVLQIHVTHVRDYASYGVVATSDSGTFTATFNLLPESSSSHRVSSDRFGVGVGVGFAALLPVIVIGIIVGVCFIRRNLPGKKEPETDQETHINMASAHYIDSPGEYQNVSQDETGHTDR